MKQRGYDAAKKITGRKRHLAVDTLGLLLAVVVHSASCQDQDGAKWVMEKLGEQFCRIKVVFGDFAYGRNNLPLWVQQTFGWLLQTVLRPVGVKGFVVLPKRWIVERTFAWLARHRRHSKDYEKTTASAEALTYIAMIGLMSKRLALLKKLNFKTRSKQVGSSWCNYRVWPVEPIAGPTGPLNLGNLACSRNSSPRPDVRCGGRPACKSDPANKG